MGTVNVGIDDALLTLAKWGVILSSPAALGAYILYKNRNSILRAITSSKAQQFYKRATLGTLAFTGKYALKGAKYVFKGAGKVAGFTRNKMMERDNKLTKTFVEQDTKLKTPAIEDTPFAIGATKQIEESKELPAMEKFDVVSLADNLQMHFSKDRDGKVLQELINLESGSCLQTSALSTEDYMSWKHQRLLEERQKQMDLENVIELEQQQRDRGLGLGR